MTSTTLCCPPAARAADSPGLDGSAPSVTGAAIAGSLIFGFIFFAFIAALFYFRYRHGAFLARMRRFDLEALRINSQQLDYRSWRKRVREYLWATLCGERFAAPDPPHAQAAARGRSHVDAPAVGVRPPQPAHLYPPTRHYHFHPEYNMYVMYDTVSREAAHPFPTYGTDPDEPSYHDGWFQEAAPRLTGAFAPDRDAGTPRRDSGVWGGGTYGDAVVS